MNDKILCVYHGNCADGFGAAWVVRKRLGKDVDFYPGVYQNEPPDVCGRVVVLVDFSYKRPVMERIAERAESVLIIDHHKSAIEDLEGFGSPIQSEGWMWFKEDAAASDDYRCRTYFDLERSGAGLAWDFFFPTKPRPKLIDILEDRDLWRFRFENTREVQATVFSHPYDFKVWDQLMETSLECLAVEGRAIERKHHKDIAELLKVVTRRMRIGGQVVPVANLPYTLTSDAGHALAEGEPFAACYWDTPDGRVFSLRSRPEGADVSEVAKAYGGGGHPSAAGFRVPYSDLAQFEV